VALRALQRDRDRRLPSAQALADSIEAVAAAEGIDASAGAVHALLQRLFPNPEDLGEEEAPRGAGEIPLVEDPPETPPHGVTALDDLAVPIEVAELPTSPVPSRRAAPKPAPARRISWTRAFLLTAAAGALLAGAVTSRTWLARLSARLHPVHLAISSSRSPISAHEPQPAREDLPALTISDTQAQAPAESDLAEATVRVLTDGPATLQVDGTSARLADDGLLHVAAGRHTLVVSSPTLAFPRTLTLELKPGESITRVVRGGRGTLRIAVTPWAEVIVDGRSLGVTPLQPAELAEGTHVVTLKNPEIGVTTRRKIAVLPNREALLKVDLFGR
jgi:hypothetical protein